MISLIRGRIAEKSVTHVTIDVGGVGYLVNAPLSTIANLPPEGNEATLHIHTHVREDQFSLYGFQDQNEKHIFQLLLKVQGIGPKTAIAILSTMSHTHIGNSIATGDTATLCSIPGIGKKTAERIIIELRGKVSAPASKVNINKLVGGIRDDLFSALINLGYQRGEAEKVLEKIDWSKTTELESALKAALKALA